MAKVTKKNTSEPSVKGNAPDAVPQGGLVAPREYLLASFTQKEIAGLLRIRRAATEGRYSEITQEYKQLMFARWLVEHGRLDG
jgi:hypothetical protein